MTGSREKPEQQRAERQPPAKRQKRSSHAVSSNENSIETTKITDLNHDCLEKIFDRLDINAFFNTALSNKSLQMAAAAAFNRRFGVNRVILDPTEDNHIGVYNDDELWIGGLKPCLQFVRCFGEIITDLTVWNGPNAHLNKYIQQYCADTLIKITFRCVTLHRNSFQKQFKKVDVVSISDVELNDGALSCFVDWFPNMRHLIYATDNDFHHKICSPVSLPQLQQMTISSKHPAQYVDFLCANPQLQAIELIERRMAMKRSLDIIKSHGSILKLKMSNYWYSCHNLSICVYPKDAKQLVHEHPLLVEVDLPKYRFNAKTVMILVRQLKALKMFRFEVNNQAEYDDILKQLDGEWHHDVSNKWDPELKVELNEANWPLFIKLTR